MKVYVKGDPNPTRLTQREYVGAGGEGVIYAKGSVAFKIYHDPKKMVPLGKIQELSTITDPRVIKPQRVLTDSSGHPLGYTMRFIKRAWALCQMFPQAFRDRNGVSHKMVLELVRQLQESVQHIHQAGILIVDLNEMNFLVSKQFDDLYFIDADSYQTRHFKATALMPSVRDWKCQLGDFTELSDWFSFGVVSFQMLTGIHPFKGKHPRIKGMEKRMQQGISVFDPDVRVPAAAYDFSVIPDSYRQWYEAVFEQGKRCPPPSEFGAVIIVMPKVKTVTGTNLLDIIEIGGFDGTVMGLWTEGTKLVVATDKNVYVDGRPSLTRMPKVLAGVVFTPCVGRPILVNHDNSVPGFTNLVDRKSISFGLDALEVTTYDGRAYLRTSNAVHEIVLTNTGITAIASSQISVSTLEHASRLYSGVVVQNLLGATYVSLLVSTGATHQVRIEELDEYRVMDARYEDGVLMVVGEKQGQYDRLVFRIELSLEYDVRVVEDIQPTGLNFTVLDSGVCVCLNEEEHLELFSTRKGSSTVKTVKDPTLGGDMILGKMGAQVIFARGNKVYKMRMK
jgi:hypothetical protein